MLNTDQSHFRKYLATLGVAVIAGTLSLAGLFLRTNDGLLITAAELQKLTPSARHSIVMKQGYQESTARVLPALVALGVLTGAGLTIFGLRGWARRQQVTDEREDLERDKTRTEVRRLSAEERLAKTEQDVSDTTPEQAASPESDPEGDSADKAGTVRGPTQSAQTRALLNRTMRAELDLAGKLRDALPADWDINLGVEIAQGGRKQQIDIAAIQRITGRTMLVEVKYVQSSFAKNIRNVLSGALMQLAAASSLMSEENLPILLVIYTEATPETVKNAEEWCAGVVRTFTRPPVVLFLSESDWDDLTPAAFHSLLPAGW
ncbi:hypothetical protein M3697_11055 [Janibacter melonis]|uniref:hypothetical protein n=1 Tax=Janibacter melonis TaxID=262209 RepID=UPI0020433C25|nr:hypothetical protein [Janibacter melonis]MCM3555641.1 hypothetical protein [Janibacter melonis]